MSTKRQLKTAVLLTVCVGAGAARADVSPVYVYPAMFYSTSDSGRYAANDYGFQMSLGYKLNRNWSLEGVTESTKYRLDDGSGYMESHGASLQGTYNFHHYLPDFPVQPLAMTGLGWLHTDTPVRSYQTMTARAGLGALWEIPGTHLDLRTDAVVRHEFNARPVLGSTNNAQFNDMIVSLGLSYQFGQPLLSPVRQEATPGATNPFAVAPKPVETVLPGASEEKVAAPAAAAPTSTMESQKVKGFLSTGAVTANDQDGDGVDDEHDKCADTPPGAVVDADGCIIFMKK